MNEGRYIRREVRGFWPFVLFSSGERRKGKGLETSFYLPRGKLRSGGGRLIL